ncbi:hypothetical protein [Sphingobacterium griseoflavum]|nr:hypothetical protein [Sphingobacterium griseoflavum]
MKQVTITTGKATIVVVDLPIGSEIESAIFINNFGRYIRFWSKGKDYLIDLPEEWNLYHAGHPSQLTEEDWKGIVGTVKDTPHGDTVQLVDRFENYAKHGYLSCNSATESGLSLLKDNEVDDSWLNPQVFVKV